MSTSGGYAQSSGRRRRWPLIGAIVLCATVLASAAAVAAVNASGVFGRRYCELLLVRSTPHGLVADVYNTYGLNTCPPRAWNAIDTTSVAKANHALVAVRNGPRFWLMNEIYKLTGARIIKNLGGVRMFRAATVALTSASQVPYTIHRVDRGTVFTYNAGQTVYELRGPDGTRWVMQSWSRQIDPKLSHRDLAKLGSRLRLPPGWRYRTRRLTKPMRIVTTRAAAQVIQDNLDDTYSRL